MPSSRKRKASADLITSENWEANLRNLANKSDSDDLDYQEAGPSSSRRSRKSKKSRSKPARKRRKYGSDGEGEEDSLLDSDEIDESDELTPDDSGADEDEINPRTGRVVRKSTKKEVKYEESEDNSEDDFGEEDEDADDDDDDDEVAPPKRRLIVTLHISSEKLATVSDSPLRRQTRSRGRSKSDIGEGPVSRRSARLSRDPSPQLLELTDSGRHAQPAGSAAAAAAAQTPEPSSRPTRGGKGVAGKGPAGKGPKMIRPDVSTITEESSMKEEEQLLPIDSIERAEVADSHPNSPAEVATREPSAMSVDPPVEPQEVSHAARQEPEPEPSRDDEAAMAPSAGESPSKRGAKKKKNDDDEDDEWGPEGEGESDGSESHRGERSRHHTSSRSGPQSRHTSFNSNRDISVEELEDLSLNKKKRSRVVEEAGYVSRNRKARPMAGSLKTYIDFEDTTMLQPDDNSPVQRSRKPRINPGQIWQTAGIFGPAPTQARGGAVGGVDSDSSDDEPVVPTAGPGKPIRAGGDGGFAGGPANHGRITNTDSNPLGVANIDFDSVGGLDDHIAKLKEMVVLPLLYPEVFSRLKIQPPRGVLFHGPPGTGKTLLARALASSVTVDGRSVTFYMRKGADALSKWVGEAERSLRLLFEEAKKNQPSIIFFDELDGLAPVRSSKQEQIHASIVTTLLALIDGMESRGQVVVIGATNRPDAIDPAMRRPGRFDREFYFPLPNQEARRKILDIHTKGWEPPLEADFKDRIATLTKGYGGADLRALSTEAGINAVKGTYPQIYKSDKKLEIDPTKIRVTPKDFLLALDKMTPSSERQHAAVATPLPQLVEPLLRRALSEVSKLLNDTIPQKRKLTELEEAEYDDRDDPDGFNREEVAREFERGRIFRPRLLIKGLRGMGQHYLGSALLQKCETLHVQHFDLATLLEDSSRSPEAAIIALFKEIRQRKPSVIFISQVDSWYNAVGSSVIKTFTSLLRNLRPDDAVLLLGTMDTESEDEKPDPAMLRDLFGFSSKSTYSITRPTDDMRYEFFQSLITHIAKRPSEFPDPDRRKKRKLEDLPVVQEKPKEPPTKEELKKQRKADRHTLVLLKFALQPIIGQIKGNPRWRKFKNSIVDLADFQYLIDEQDPAHAGNSNLTEEQRQQQAQGQAIRPFERAKDKHGVWGLKRVFDGKFFYNLSYGFIEQRVLTGYYKRFKDFHFDVRTLAKDAKNSGDTDLIIKADEIVALVEVEMNNFETNQPAMVAECEAVFAREQARAKLDETTPAELQNVPPQIHESTTTAETASGPIVLGGTTIARPIPPPATPQRAAASNGETYSNGSTVPSRPVDPADAQSQPAFGPSQMETPSAPNTQQRSQRSAIEKMPPGSQIADFHNSASTTASAQKTGTDHSNRSSDPSHFNPGHTQSTNGATDHADSQHLPDWNSMLPALSGGSQIPDTQGTSSRSKASKSGSHITDLPSTQQSGSEASSQAHAFSKPALPRHIVEAQAQVQTTGFPSAPATSTAVGEPSSIPVDASTISAPATATATVTAGAGADADADADVAAFTASSTSQPLAPHTSNIVSMLNPTESSPTDAAATTTAIPQEPEPEPEPEPTFLLDPVVLSDLHRDLALHSAGLTVEQLEQVMSRCLAAVWDGRALWNRHIVADHVRAGFEEVLRDVHWQTGLAMEGVEFTNPRDGEFGFSH